MAKSLISQRRERGAICDVCKSPDYKMLKNESFEGAKPIFECGQCKNRWMYRYDGGKYAELASEMPVQNDSEQAGSVTCSCGKTAYVYYDNKRYSYKCDFSGWKFIFGTGWHCGTKGHRQV